MIPVSNLDAAMPTRKRLKCPCTRWGSHPRSGGRMDCGGRRALFRSDALTVAERIT
jgi:hypothetical protein